MSAQSLLSGGSLGFGLEMAGESGSDLNPNGAVENDPFTALVAPTIAMQPADRTAPVGSSTTFAVTLDDPNVSALFLWRRDGMAIPGANSASYTIDSAGTADGGRYTCDVWNSEGSETSRPATLTVVSAAQVGRLVSFSVVAAVDTPGAVLSLECVVGGAGTSGAKSILVRAAGPSLARFGVANFNSDPALEVYSGATNSGGNDNWGGQPSVVEAAARVGAFAFGAKDSTDAAMVIDAAAGTASTIRISGHAGATGTVLAEIYDATPVSAVTLATPRLLKFSVLKSAPAGSSVSAGFVIAGQTPRTVLVRVVGPTLENFGVTAAMADPVLTLFQDVTPVASNAGWGGAPELQRLFASVGAFALEASSGDAALVMSLVPGSYAVEASEAYGRGGTALIEIYEVP